MTQNDFQSRLQRIAEARGEQLSEGAALLPSDGRTGKRRYAQAREGRAGGIKSVLRFSLLSMAILVIPAMLLGDLMGEGIMEGTGGGSETAVPVLSRILDTSQQQGRAAWTYLPPAPDGWLRVTPDDALPEDVQGSIDLVAARWDGGEEALRALPGFQVMGRYLDEAGKPPSMMNRKTPRSRGQVMYLHPDGSTLILTLTYLRETRALGEVGAEESWIETLAARTQRKFRHEVRRDSLGGIPVISQYRTVGGLESPPLGDFPGLPRPVDLTMALAPRAILSMAGLATPRVLTELLEDIDRQEIRFGVPGSGRATARVAEPATEPEGFMHKLFFGPGRL